MTKEEFCEELRRSTTVVWLTDIDRRKPWDEPSEMVGLDHVIELLDKLEL